MTILPTPTTCACTTVTMDTDSRSRSTINNVHNTTTNTASHQFTRLAVNNTGEFTFYCGYFDMA